MAYNVSYINQSAEMVPAQNEPCVKISLDKEQSTAYVGLVTRVLHVM